MNRTFRDSHGEQKEDVSFIDCSAWGKLGEMINQYAKKGTGVLVSGRLSQHSWEDKDGKKRSRTEIVVEDFNFTTSGNRGDSGASSSAPAADTSVPADIPDEIPEEIDLSEVPF